MLAVYYIGIMEMQGLTAVITGASGRLGGAIALALAEAGCNCICHYFRNKTAAEAVAAQAEKKGVRAFAVAADLTDPAEIEALFTKVSQFGTPQVLVNSAAVFSKQNLNEVSLEEAQKILNLNLMAPILASRAFAKIANTGFEKTQATVGKIINISDVGAVRPWAGYVIYCSSKAALNGATKALAKELAPAICVNSVAPGIVTWSSDLDETKKKRQLGFIPVGRIGQPSEIARAVLFFVKNDYITGQVLNVDGGRCI